MKQINNLPIPKLTLSNILESLLYRYKSPVTGEKKLHFIRPLALWRITKNNIPEKKVARNEEISHSSPFEGKIIKAETTFIWGIAIPHKRVLCTIDNAGIISSKKDANGWVDKTGQIHKGMNGSLNSSAKVENIVGEIIDGDVYLGKIRVGYLKK